MNGRMRDLLRQLHDPRAADEHAPAGLLSNGADRRGYRGALVDFIETTLRDYDPRYREIVIRTDVEGKPGKQVAHELALAQRTYYRLRAVAMRALDRALERRLQDGERALSAGASADLHAALFDAVAAVDPARARAILGQLEPAGSEQRLTELRLRVAAGDVPDETDIDRLDPAHRFAGEVWRARALESAGGFAEAERLVAALEASLDRAATDRVAAFDLALLRRLQARRHGRAAEFVAAVDDLIARADGLPELQTHAAIAYAHVGIHRSIDDWRERLDAAKSATRAGRDVAMLRYATMVEGYLAYVHDDPELALNRSRISTIDGANPNLALQGEALHARALLVLGRPWERPLWTRDVLPNTWFQPELDALAVHHAVRRGDADAARRLAAAVREHPATPLRSVRRRAAGCRVSDARRPCGRDGGCPRRSAHAGRHSQPGRVARRGRPPQRPPSLIERCARTSVSRCRSRPAARP